MRLRFLLDIHPGKDASSTEVKPKRWIDLIVRCSVVAMILGSLWIVAGSVLYPLYWFEFIFKGGFRDWSFVEYGLNYLLQNAAWVFFGFPAGVIILWLMKRRWVASIGVFTSRFGVDIIVACTLALCLDGYIIYRTQRFNYEVTLGLRNVATALVESVKALVSLDLPPSGIMPPVYFLYVDSQRIEMLYSQLQPTLSESERTLVRESKRDTSMGLDRKPMELKTGESEALSESHKFKSVAPSISQECLSVINDLLSRQSPPYYSTFEQLSGFQTRNQARQVLGSFHAIGTRPSLFLYEAPNGGAVDALREMAAARQRTPAAEIEKGVRAQLSSISGLILVQGDFSRTSFAQDSAQYEEQFKKGPNTISFRFMLNNKVGVRLLSKHSTLLVLGDAIGRWDGGPHFDFYPIAIASGTPTIP